MMVGLCVGGRSVIAISQYSGCSLHSGPFMLLSKDIIVALMKQKQAGYMKHYVC